MYTQALNVAEATDDSRRRRPRSQVSGAGRCRGKDRAERLDAGGVSQDAGPADRAARAFRNRRHAARGQLDHARAVAQAQGRAARQGAGRGRPRRSISMPPPRRSACRARSWSSSCLDGKQKYSSIFNYPTLTWADIGIIGWLVDGAAIMNQIPLCRCSYGPYARAMIRICKEESFHQRQGYEIMVTLCRDGTPEQKAMAQDALNRWWWPVLMMFGPSDKDSSAHRQVDALEDQALHQRRAAAEIRRCHRAAGPLSRADIPGPRSEVQRRRPGTGTSARSTGPSSSASSQGDGPCNRQRIKQRQDATEAGAWVREAAMAYAREAQARREAAMQVAAE